MLRRTRRRRWKYVLIFLNDLEVGQENVLGHVKQGLITAGVSSCFPKADGFIGGLPLPRSCDGYSATWTLILATTTGDPGIELKGGLRALTAHEGREDRAMRGA